MEHTCTIKKNVTLSAHVVAEFPISWWEWSGWKDGKRTIGTQEDYGKCLEAKCKEFHDFLRDHRSQDIVSLSVEREKADVCSACGEKWEAWDEDGIVSCASCGAVLEQDVPIDAEVGATP